MSPEVNILKEPQDPLLPGHRVLFPNPGFLIAAAFSRKEKGIHDVSVATIDMELFDKNSGVLLREYGSVLDLIRSRVGRRNVTIVRNRVTFVSEDPDTLESAYEEVEFEDLDEYENTKLKASGYHSTIWLRDGFMVIGGTTFLNPISFSHFEEGEETVKSVLGEGGAVLTAGKAVLVSEEFWKMRKEDTGFRILQEKGFTVAPLPPVNPLKQKSNWFAESHIDGHAALIVDKDGRLRLLVAESYSRQGNDTRKKIRFAAETVGAEMTEIVDGPLPPLALNFIQFEDGSVVVSRGETNDLTFVLELLLGPDKVLETAVPLVRIPSILAGGIRCMTNTLPTSLLRKLETLT